MARPVRSNFGRVEQVSPGKYRIWWKAGYGSDGKRLRPSATVNATREEAEAELARRYLGANRPDSDITYGQLWDGVVEPSLASLSPRTADGHKRIWRAELKDRILEVQVRDTTRTLVEDTLAEIESAWVQRSTLATWRKMYNMAGLDRRNPFDRSLRTKKAVPAKRPYLDASEVPKWLGLIDGKPWAPPLIASAGGGLRHEEACALDACDLSPFERDGRAYVVLDIRKALVSAVGGRLLKDAKNGFSERVMIIGEPFSLALMANAPESGPLCPSARGGDGAKAYASPTDITAAYREHCGKKGAKYVNPGKLRGSWRTMQSEAGSPDALVRKAMGHAGGETDERSYLRASRRGLMMIADNLTDLIEDDLF